MQTEEDLEGILDQRDGANTNKVKRASINIFNEYLRARDCACLENTELNCWNSSGWHDTQEILGGSVTRWFFLRQEIHDHPAIQNTETLFEKAKRLL